MFSATRTSTPADCNPRARLGGGWAGLASNTCTSAVLWEWGPQTWGSALPTTPGPSRFTSAVPRLASLSWWTSDSEKAQKQRIVGRSTPRLRSAEAVAAVGRCVVRAVVLAAVAAGTLLDRRRLRGLRTADRGRTRLLPRSRRGALPFAGRVGCLSERRPGAAPSGAALSRADVPFRLPRNNVLPRGRWVPHPAVHPQRPR